MPAGNFVLLGGVDASITKTATLVSADVDPAFDSVRSDPRFAGGPDLARSEIEQFKRS